MKKLSLILIFLLNGMSSSAADTKFLRNTKTRIKDPYSLRDPFKKKIIKTSTGLQRTKKYLGTELTNIKTLDKIPISEIAIVGVLLGKERRALARTISASGKVDKSNTFILKEGMKLGLDNAVLKAILPGGIVIVEKIRNVYDEDEYIETIIPVVPE